MAKPPTSLPPSGAAPLHVSLLLGSFVHSPATLDLFDLHIPPSAPAPVHPDEQIYHPRPELAHTFRPDPKLPPRIISAFFTALVVAPWVVLLGLVRVFVRSTWRIRVSLIIRVAHSGALSSRARRAFCRRASCLSCSLSFSLRVYCFGIGSNFVSARFFCTVRALLHSLFSPVNRRSWVSLCAGPVAASKNVT